MAINERSPSIIAFSAITTPDSPYYERVCQMERLAPPSEKRFMAMRKIAEAGILTGICFMPILPGLCDDEANLEAILRWTAGCGGKFILASGLTLADQQKDYFFNVLRERFPDLLSLYQKFYPVKSYAPAGWPWHKIALRIRELCVKYSLQDRIPRPIIPGDKRALNKRIVENLANRGYDMEINDEPDYRVWAYRKAAWAIEDLEQDIDLIYRTMGLPGLQSIPNVGSSLAKEIEQLIRDLTVKI